MTPKPREAHRHLDKALYVSYALAMSFAVAGTRISGVTICDVECVAKTYPRFFDDLKSVTTSA